MVKQLHKTGKQDSNTVYYTPILQARELIQEYFNNLDLTSSLARG